LQLTGFNDTSPRESIDFTVPAISESVVDTLLSDVALSPVPAMIQVAYLGKTNENTCHTNKRTLLYFCKHEVDEKTILKKIK